ncbi:MAG TPA: glycosyltransferase, partial [Xanthomonadales bacterium]|nr:glycosyltransferase [Xanthomonadales bacterium]
RVRPAGATRMKLSIVLPCYNEARTLPALLARYRAVWRDLPAELILVDNGSTDDTPATLARELARPEHAFARSVRVARNRGYGHGIATGLRAARGEFLAFSHADMQCDAADVFAAYDRLSAEADPRRAIVKGKRAPRGFAASLITTGMSAIASAVLLRRLTDINAQPKVFHRSHLDRLARPPDGFAFDLYVLYIAARAGLRVVTVPVRFERRLHGQSRWNVGIVSRYRTILRTVGFIWKLRLGRA